MLSSKHLFYQASFVRVARQVVYQRILATITLNFVIARKVKVVSVMKNNVPMGKIVLIMIFYSVIIVDVECKLRVKLTFYVIPITMFANAEDPNVNNSKIAMLIQRPANVELLLDVEKHLLATLKQVFAYVTIKHALIQKLVI